MCGHGRNKPSRGVPHFLIASCPPSFASFHPSPPAATNGDERNGTEAESERDLSCHCLSALVNAPLPQNGLQVTSGIRTIPSRVHHSGSFRAFPPIGSRRGSIWAFHGVVTRRNLVSRGTFSRLRKNAINERKDCFALELITNPDLSTMRLFMIGSS